MGSKLSCCFRVEKSLPEQELEVLRDVQMEVECTAASNFIPTQQPHKIRVSCLIWTSKHLFVNVLFVKSISSTGIKVPTTTPSGSGVPTSLSTTSQRPHRRGVGLPQLLHTLPLVLGPKEEWTRGEWNACWGELMPMDMFKALLLSGQCRKWKVFFLWCSKRDRCRWRNVFFQSWPITNSTQF